MKAVLINVGIPVATALVVISLLNFVRYVGYREGLRDGQFVEKLHAANETLDGVIGVMKCKQESKETR